ncbi:patatin-like phospholipase family protein [Dankookia sp. GCM10030260]|uniref:patatin-like phospholipase family protein n=1 Tax=Dankookia sp. GCM10030260 TaxID=3273390 RepID=UPI003618B814
MERKLKIAIACQGGGSQTAFTAGALKALFEARVHDRFEIVSLSGTSGGSICAALAWYALRKRDPVPWQRLAEFWAENTAQSPAEEAFNSYTVGLLRAVSSGHVAIRQGSPSSAMMQMATGMVAKVFRPHFTDLRALLEAHIDFEELRSWGPSELRPVLLVGAVNVLNGHLAQFTSRASALRVEHILASCAVPSIFPAVEFDGGAYWDGLFSDNPPINELIRARCVGAENIPDEIWVIKINATGSANVPVSPDAIADRRNELVGNVSLFQQLRSIGFINDLLLADAFRPEFLQGFDVQAPIGIPKCYREEPDRPYHIPCIEMSAGLQESLDHASKLDRSTALAANLMADGERQARAFLKQRGH